ncbi:hypothetical protein GCM10017774_58700 [Lentzea cavernae]|uniref:Uncharacterized protein n=1 Tax=Lentzea cavernae TaxID=2020703 RepID=A0ABQ3MKX3_9PSEU|nr:hypothetical protein GCM10017774_58700 [Lentzea cavernae]
MWTDTSGVTQNVGGVFALSRIRRGTSPTPPYNQYEGVGEAPRHTRLTTNAPATFCATPLVMFQRFAP